MDSKFSAAISDSINYFLHDIGMSVVGREEKEKKKNMTNGQYKTAKKGVYPQYPRVVKTKTR